MRIFRLAAVKDKLKGKYKSILADPYVTFFLWNGYENVIPWGDIKPETSVPDINNYVNKVMLPKLYGKMDINSKDNNYYNKEIDVEFEYKINPGDVVTQKAHEMLPTNPKGAQDLLRKFWNNSKKQIFDEWKNGLNYYSDKPSFIYMILNKMLEESPENEKTIATPHKDFALKELLNEIKKDPSRQFNVWKYYRDKVNTTLFGALKYVDKKGSGWKHIPSRIKDPKNFEDNVKALTNLSIGNGWCTGYGQAEPYLSGGDFWLYIESSNNVKRARVAIKMIGSETAEVRGVNNGFPSEYAEQILDLYAGENLNPISAGSYSYTKGQTHPDIVALNKIYDGVNKKLESGKMTWKDITYPMYQQLSETNRDKMPEEERERVAKEFLKNGIGIDTTIPPTFEKYAFIIEAKMSAWTKELHINPSVFETARFPTELREREDIKNIRLQAWSNKIAQDESQLETAPADIINTPSIYEKVLDNTVLKITANPLEYNNVSIAMRRGQQRIIDLGLTVVVPAIIVKLKQNPMYYDYIAYEFINNVDVINAFKEGYIALIKKQPVAKNTLICKKSWGIDLIKSLNKTKEIEDAYKEGVQEYMRRKGFPTTPATPAKPQEQPQKPEVQTPPPNEPPIQASKNNKLVCSCCKSKIEKISRSVHANEEIYRCLKCENMGTLDEI